MKHRKQAVFLRVAFGKAELCFDFAAASKPASAFAQLCFAKAPGCRRTLKYVLSKFAEGILNISIVVEIRRRANWQHRL